MRTRRILHAATASVLLVVSTAGGPFAQGKGTVLLSMGELVDLELLHHVNSKHDPPGSDLYFRVVNDIPVKGVLVVSAGIIVRGSMAAATGNKSFGRAGKMEIDLGNLRAVDDTSVPLEGEIERKGRTRYGATSSRDGLCFRSNRR